MKPKPAKKGSKRTPQVALLLTSVDAMVGQLNRLCELQIEITRMTAEHEEAIANLNSQHEEELQPLREQLAACEASVQLYCISHRDTLFPGEKKSLEYTNAVIGFRQDPPSVKPVVPKEKEETLAARLAESSWGADYMDWKPILHKANLLRDRETITPEQLAEVGLKFVSEEHFFIAPKAESGERITKDAREVA